MDCISSNGAEILTCMPPRVKNARETSAADVEKCSKRWGGWFRSLNRARHYVNTKIIGLAAIQTTIRSALPNFILSLFFSVHLQKLNETLKIYDRL